MDGGDSKLIATLLERVSAKLPNRSGDDLEEVRRDEIVSLSRGTLISLAKSQAEAVARGLVGLLDNVSQQYEAPPQRNRPSLVALTQVFLLELLADCLEAHWDAVDDAAIAEGRRRPDSRHNSLTTGPQYSPSTARKIRCKEPPPWDDAQARHLLDIVLRLFSNPINYEEAAMSPQGPPPMKNGSSSQLSEEKTSEILPSRVTEVEKSAFKIIEYLSASNWNLVFQTLQNILKALRAAMNDDMDTSGMQLLAHLWINSKQLSAILSELYASFLHLRKPYQHCISILLPETIQNWVDSHPHEFVNLHMSQRRLEGGADVLFDIANNMVDSTKKRAMLWPLQTSLVLLLPEVFLLASMLGEVNRSTNAKRVLFLETLRKSLRLPRSSDIAGTCLVTICRAASHFPMESDSAVLSFALDVQNEMREEIFKRHHQEDALVEKEVMVKAFVALCHLSKDQVVDNLVNRCLDKTAPMAFKIACFAGTAIIATQDKTNSFASLYQAIAPDIREYLHAIGTARKASVPNGVMRKQDNSSSDSLLSVELLYQILELLKVRPYLLYEGAPKNSEESPVFFEKILSSILNCITDDDTLVRTLSAEFARRLVSRDSFGHHERGGNKTQMDLQIESWKGASAILVTFSRKLLDFDLSDPALKIMLALVRDYMETRLQFLRGMKTLVEAGADVAERQIAGISLEVSLLVLLCSSDLEICSLTTSAIGILCEEGRLTENLEDLDRSGLSVMKNYSVYSELSSQTFRMTGPVAFQKRLRKLLVRMNRPTAGILTAWESVFTKWKTLCKTVTANNNSRAGSLDESQRTQVEWRNYSGFLAALGGCCIAVLPQDLRIDDSSVAGLRWIDRLAPDGDSMSLLDRFLKQCLQLLVCSNVGVREAIREVLGSEMNPRLYVQLFHSLELELNSMLENPPPGTSNETRLLFAEQATSLLRAIIDRIEDTQESLLSVDFGALTLILARYLHTQKEDAVTLRVKIKMCQLVEVVSRKKDILNLRQDIRVRNSLLQTLSEWMSRPPKSGDPPVQPVNRPKDEVIRLQKDLDRASLKALVNLLARLPLQPTESHDADALDAKSQLFCTYFTLFLNLLEAGQNDPERKRDLSLVSLARDDASSSLELAILALSNLLSANVDVGLKFSLEIGYHDNLEIRTAFMHVLTNILTQGTEFSSLGDSAIGEKYERLIDLLVSDMKFVLTLCDCCPSSEVDEIAISLLNIFDSKGLGLTLLKGLIEQEVTNAESESELLRRNCVATKMLSVFAKWKGAAYLRTTLQRVLERLIVSSDELDLELDPERTSGPEELQRNALQLRFVTNVFIDEICKSVNAVPASFRFICHTITTSVTGRFPEAKFTAVGAFIFLRFFCPAIVAPDSEGLVSSIPKKEMRRGLLLIAKVVQNLANNVLFGAKEPYMIPLNDFLTANIYRVTTFLRDISSPPKLPEQTATPHETFDFGSSIALHRFLYDHWETVRQKIFHQQRLRAHRDNNKDEEAELRASITKFSALIPTLGAPPLDMSWSRPQMSPNVQPSYYRFQQFMLRNSGRSVEPITSARIVYDGGESKDGTPVICFVLRHLNAEQVDPELLLYCFFKIASRMWSKNFGVLVDATSYTVSNELSEEMTRKMEYTMPPEMMKTFKKFYVYNMNSAYRKTFRRIVRHACKDESSPLHPRNIEYLLLGNLSELQQHFHLASLHLPKDTISLVTDSRFVFQPVTRLSKTKGRIDVIIKVGSQYIQITTTKKLEIVPGLRMHATVNDIFQLSDIEEANASFHTDEENAFGIKTENGKVAMFFSSPKRLDVLQSIKSAKSKQLKDNKPSKLSERTIRPEDVPGTLLNIALMNMGSSDQSLRIAAYNLLCALCQTFHFNIDRKFVSAKGLSIPTDSLSLIVGVSEKLSVTEPQLTFDFLTEFFVGWEKSPQHQRPLNILYMVPWLSNLQSQVLALDGDSERGKERLANLARKLIEMTVHETRLYTAFKQNAWSIISKDESLLEVFFEELMKSAINYGFGSSEADVIGSIASSFGTLTMRGKIIARLRKALNRTSLRPTRHLKDNAVWKEMCVLLRICLAISFDSRAQAQMFLPELFHIITMVVNCGSLSVRTTVHSLLVNTVHSICTSFPLDDENLSRLKAILASLSEPKIGLLFSLNRPTSRDTAVIEEQRGAETASISSMETITTLLLDIIAIAAPSIDMANIWRARWMSLVASTAFQNNPAIQPRAFAVMGCLAREDVDDDLLYQVLVALRSALSRFVEQGDFEMLASIITSLTKMMDNLPSTSRYLHQLFWLSMSLVRVGPPAFYNCSAGLLQAVLRVIASSGELKDGRMNQVLMQGRLTVEDAAAAVDDLFGIHFTAERFAFAATYCLVKGLSDPITKSTAINTLDTFLEVTVANAKENSPDRIAYHRSFMPYLAMVAMRLSNVEDLKEYQWMCGLPSPSGREDDQITFQDMLPPSEGAPRVHLILGAAFGFVDFRVLEEAAVVNWLKYFEGLAANRPDVFCLVHEQINSQLEDILITSQNSAVLTIAHSLMRTITADERYKTPVDATEDLKQLLQEVGFTGVFSATSFKAVSKEHERLCISYIDRLIELIIA